ncbi:MAG: TIGR01458 family HAD-type hydrolase [Candidatus Krumholzibacteria bacterium]|nr:TIGR01458 family HAD-type hydrolase [Candidatus Krumholzibacteria bacterium]
MSAVFAGIAGILSDMDGVWCVGAALVPGAAEALATIRDRALPIRLVTNTTTQTAAELAERLQRMGLAFAPEEIINAPGAAARYLRGLGRPSCHVIAAPSVRAEFAEFPASDRPDWVVLGDIGQAWTYGVLNEAFRMLMGGARLMAMHKGRYWQVDDGLALDIGAFVSGLEYATGKEAVIAGKPSATMFAAALRDLGVDAARALMIGDDIHADVAGAQRAGLRGVLVRTGKYREDVVRVSGVTADAVIDSIADLARLL